MRLKTWVKVFVPFLGDFFSITTRRSAQKEIDALKFSSPSSGTFFQYAGDVMKRSTTRKFSSPSSGTFFQFDANEEGTIIIGI